MLNKLEKAIMLFIYDLCLKQKSVLVSPLQLKIALLPNFEITDYKLEKIINNLSLDGYIDLVHTRKKGAKIYCVSLKSKGFAFKRELEVIKKRNKYLVKRTIILAFLSVTVSFILRSILS